MIFITILHTKCFIFFIILYSVSSTINPNNRPQIKKQEYVKLRTGPQLQNVYQRGLIQKEPFIKDILIENAGYYHNTTLRNFHGKFLCYVRPWDLSYNLSLTLAQKFDIIAPVSFDITRTGLNSYNYYGSESFEDKWFKNIVKYDKTSNKILEVYPRVVFKFSDTDITKLFTFETERKALYRLIIEKCTLNNFDGIVLEVWHGLAKRVYQIHLYNLIRNLSLNLKSEGFNLILVIPAWHTLVEDLFTAQNFENLYSYVEYFALKTYEYSTVERPGLNAPLDWMRKAVENIVPSTAASYKWKRRKILMGLNIYGYDYTSDNRNQINGQQYIDLLKLYNNRLKFDDQGIEHFFILSKSDGRHMVFYPTLYSINERIKLAEELGVGLALVELSQGLNYFFDLF